MAKRAKKDGNLTDINDTSSEKTRTRNMKKEKYEDEA